MPTHKRDVHGFKVTYEDDASKGADYLDHDLDREEARVFFEQAKLKGEAKFEDDDDRDYTLIKNRDGSYTLSRRKSGGGGWF